MTEKKSTEIQQLFLQEMVELLQHIEADTLSLEANPEEMEQVNTLFRYFHTLKGGAGMSGFPALAHYTHQVENLLDCIRTGQQNISTELVSALLEASDCLNGFMSEATGDAPLDAARIQKSLEKLAQLSGQGAQATPILIQEPVISVQSTPSPPSSIQTFLLQLRFNPDILASKADPLAVLQQLDALGTLLVFSHPHAVPPLEQLDTGRLLLWWTIILKTTQAEETIQAILEPFQAKDGHDVGLERIAGAPSEIANQLAIDSQVTNPLAKIETIVTQPPIPTPTPPASQPAAPSPVPVKKPVETSLRVDIQKLDKLINLIGEMVIIHTRLKQSFDELPPMEEEAGEPFIQVLDDHDRIVQNLHAQAMRVRMIAIGNILFPLKRLVRDFSGQSGKPMQLTIFGEDTDVDKTIVDKLSGPLTHLIRNAMDHGIESPEIRQQRGKSPEGRITLLAANRKNSIVIEIADDGAGIDFDRVLAVARSRGLVGASETPTQAEILQFLFHSGFSTAKQVSEISGRGVGMDVVRQEIEALRGSIRIESSPGKGSVFYIELPLSLAIVEGLLVGVEKRIFVIPLLSIVETLQPSFCQFRTLKHKGELVRIRNEYVPLMRLHHLFSLPQAITDPHEGLLILVEEGGRKGCLLVDNIIDQQQVVIKSLEENLMFVEGIAGATILGDGEISLVLDIHGLLRHFTPES